MTLEGYMTTPEGILRRVEQLRKDAATSPDNERLHIEEDAILVEALEAIAADAPQSRAIAREALRTHGVVFTRWYA